MHTHTKKIYKKSVETDLGEGSSLRVSESYNLHAENAEKSNQEPFNSKWLFCINIQSEKLTQHSGQSWDCPIQTEEVQSTTGGKRDAPNSYIQVEKEQREKAKI